MAIFANCKQVVMRFIFLFISLFIFGFIYATNPDQVFGQNYELYEQAGKKGLKNDEGKIIIPAEYQEIGWSHIAFQIHEDVIGFKENGLWGLINLNNQRETEAIFTQINPTSSDHFIVSKNLNTGEFLGSINKRGTTLLPFKYIDIEVVGDRIIVGKKSRAGFVYGLLNTSGSVIMELNFKEIRYLDNDRFAAKDLDGQMTLVNGDGQRISDIQFDSLSGFKGQYAVFYDGSSRGLISKRGEVILSPKYQYIDVFQDYATVQPIDEWDILSASNEVSAVINTQYLNLFSDTYYQAETNGISVLIDHNTLAKSNNQTFNQLKSIDGNLAIFKKNNALGVVNGQGQVKNSARFDSLIIDDNLVLGKEQGSWALYDTFNIRKTNEYYQQIVPATERLFKVKKNNHWGFVNRYGEEVIDCVFDQIFSIVDNYIVVSFHNEKGVINTAGDWVVLPRKAHKLKVLNENYFIEYQGKLKKLNHVTDGIIYFTENQIDIFDGYLLEYTSDGGIWKIDFTGQIIEEARDHSYEEVRQPSEGFYAIKKDGRYGFIDVQNRLRIANRYDDVGDFSEGLAAFKLIEKWGFLNKKEEIIIQPFYEKVSQFYDNVAIAYTEEGAGLIDKQGVRITSFGYDSLHRQSNNHYTVYKGGKKGLLNGKGELIISARYDYIEDLDNEYYIVGKSGKFGLLNAYGVNTIPMIYDKLVYDQQNDRYLGLKKSSAEKVELQ